jgi:hypothetical protein
MSCLTTDLKDVFQDVWNGVPRLPLLLAFLLAGGCGYAAAHLSFALAVAVVTGAVLVLGLSVLVPAIARSDR